MAESKEVKEVKEEDTVKVLILKNHPLYVNEKDETPVVLKSSAEEMVAKGIAKIIK